MTHHRRPSRLRSLAAAIALAISVPTFLLVWASPANAAGDVCDLCSINFDLTACEGLGGYPYDSTQEDPPPAISGGGSGPAPKPEPQPQPQQPAPAAPAPSGGSSGGSSSGSSGEISSEGGGDGVAPVDGGAPQPAAVAATAPVAPAAPKLAAKGTSLTVTWTAPADGGSPLTGYLISLNGGTAIPLTGTETSYTFAKLAAGKYTATVVAVNAIGSGTASASSKPVVIEEPATATATAKATATANTSDGVPGWLAGAGLLVVLVGVGAIALLVRRLRSRPAAATSAASTNAAGPEAAEASASDGPADAAR